MYKFNSEGGCGVKYETNLLKFLTIAGIDGILKNKSNSDHTYFCLNSKLQGATKYKIKKLQKFVRIRWSMEFWRMNWILILRIFAFTQNWRAMEWKMELIYEKKFPIAVIDRILRINRFNSDPIYFCLNLKLKGLWSTKTKN